MPDAPRPHVRPSRPAPGDRPGRPASPCWSAPPGWSEPPGRSASPTRSGKRAAATLAAFAVLAALGASPALAAPIPGAGDPSGPWTAYGAQAPAATAQTQDHAPGQDQAPGQARDGLGDRLYPALGNPGYNVFDYDISLRYRANDQPLAAVTRIDALATARLRTFGLDFARGTVRSVTVNGLPARFTTRDEKLLVTPAVPVPRGGRLAVTVAHTSDPAQTPDAGWVRTPDGLAVAAQADAAHRIFPCNDHPSDKARFSFHVTAPNGLTVVANGLRESEVRHAHATTWTYRTDHLMATELTQISIGRSRVLHRTGPDGLPLRDVIGAADPKRAALEKRLRLTARQVAWMERQVGPFPFETYGILSVDTTTGFELETQTLSLFERRVLLAPAAEAAPLMVHELAHQWFGDSVSPATWSDVWLNEGHATWYQWLYAAQTYPGKDTALDAVARDAYRADQRLRDAGGPPALPDPPGHDPLGDKLGIFRGNVYTGGALTLYALRQEVGAKDFQRIERAWVARHRDGVADTDDYIALASRIAGRDLSGFLHAWLYGGTTPAMPGHPDWRTDPPLTTAPAKPEPTATPAPATPGPVSPGPVNPGPATPAPAAPAPGAPAAPALPAPEPAAPVPVPAAANAGKPA
jgi:aminopeptidase N